MTQNRRRGVDKVRQVSAFVVDSTLLLSPLSWFCVPCTSFRLLLLTSTSLDACLTQDLNVLTMCKQVSCLHMCGGGKEQMWEPMHAYIQNNIDMHHKLTLFDYAFLSMAQFLVHDVSVGSKGKLAYIQRYIYIWVARKPNFKRTASDTYTLLTRSAWLTRTLVPPKACEAHPLGELPVLYCVTFDGTFPVLCRYIWVSKKWRS